MSLVARVQRFRPAILAVIGSLLLLVGSYGVSRMVSAGKILGSVQAQGVELGGLDPGQATAALIDLENVLRTAPADFLVKDHQLSLDPETVGFGLRREVMLRRAFEVGRRGSAPEQFWWWATHLFGPVDLTVDADLDQAALEEILSKWDQEAVGMPPFDGSVQINGTVPVAQYPHGGEMIDRSRAPGLVLGALIKSSREMVNLPVVRAEPSLSSADIDRAVERARLLLAGPVVLTDTATGREATFSVATLAEALRVEVDGEVRFSFDPAVVSAALDPVLGQLEDQPVDAAFEIDGYQVRVIPGKTGTRVDLERTAANLLSVAATASRRGILPLVTGADPEVTTEELTGLGISHLVSRFTTYHKCCENRVTNIHLIADAVDGAIVRPGETFSLNAYVGERTAELGYLEDGTIIGGRLENTIGGGVSQFATTFYNAVFWGGYEDVTHRTHSFYFSRYPLGIEATISWPLPDLVFRNNRDRAILIKTEYTDTSITVEFYGWNDDRIVAGRQIEGVTKMEIIEEGGTDARRVSVSVSDRFDLREPPPPLYEADPLLAVDQQMQEQAPAQGFTVIVERTIAIGEGTQTTEWVVRYSPRQEIIRVHPCMILDTSTTIPCPTTTTILTDTTTTTVP
jgi:vancomycin resistance protein YoaR